MKKPAMVACVLFCFLYVNAAVAQPAKRMMTLEDVVSLKSVSDPQLSPDGRHIVYVVSEADLKESSSNADLWLVGTNGGTPLRLTTSKKSDNTPRWSPDGKLIAFVSAREEKPQIYRISPFGGEAEKLSDLKSAPSAIEWSPDGKQIAFIAQDPPSDQEEKKKKEKDDAVTVDREFKMSQLWVIDVGTRNASRLTNEDSLTIGQPRWSPDGKRIVFVTNPTPKADDGSLSDLWVYSFADSTSRKLTENSGPDTSPVWSPDGTTIAFLSRPGDVSMVGLQRLHVMPVMGGTSRNLTPSFDASIMSIRWSPDGSKILFLSSQSVTTHLYSLEIRSGKISQLTAGGYVVSSPTYSRDGKTVAMIHQDEMSPADIAVASGSSWKPRRVTGTNGIIDSLKLGRVEVIRWKSYDGLEIEGILLYPAEYTAEVKYPLLVYGHGGPTGAYTRTFYASWGNLGQFYSSNGWAVFYPNFRGSSNYGEKFMQANFLDWGKGDYQDIMTGIDEVVRRGVAEPRTLAFAGWSYGGYLANWIVSQTDRFKAISAGAGLSNMVSMYSTNDIQRYLEAFYGGHPWEAMEEYDKRSGMRYLKNAKSPTIIFHGQEDKRVPVSQGYELYMGLKKNNVPVEFVIFPREGHGLSEPRHQLEKMQREHSWFLKNVLGNESKPESVKLNQ